jgi:hypothetical protein
MLSGTCIVACISMMISTANHRMNGHMSTLIRSTHFRRQHGIVKNSDVEDAICQRWKEYVNFGMWVTFVKSRVIGWYNSAITIGPEPTIRTGATIHSLYVLKGNLADYKLHARTYGGESNKSLCAKHKNTVTTQRICDAVGYFPQCIQEKRILCDDDSVYTGETLGQISQEEWKIIMVGTAQTNHTGAPAVAEVQKLKVGTYEAFSGSIRC